MEIVQLAIKSDLVNLTIIIATKKQPTFEFAIAILDLRVFWTTTDYFVGFVEELFRKEAFPVTVLGIIIDVIDLVFRKSREDSNV